MTNGEKDSKNLDNETTTNDNEDCKMTTNNDKCRSNANNEDSNMTTKTLRFFDMALWDYGYEQASYHATRSTLTSVSDRDIVEDLVERGFFVPTAKLDDCPLAEHVFDGILAYKADYPEWNQPATPANNPATTAKNPGTTMTITQEHTAMSVLIQALNLCYALNMSDTEYAEELPSEWASQRNHYGSVWNLAYDAWIVSGGTEVSWERFCEGGKPVEDIHNYHPESLLDTAKACLDALNACDDALHALYGATHLDVYDWPNLERLQNDYTRLTTAFIHAQEDAGEACNHDGRESDEAIAAR